MSWSSGKDSAYALWEILRQGRMDVVGLLTAVTDDVERVSIHGVRESLLDAQARSVGLPVRKVHLPFPCPNHVYDTRMGRAVSALASEGVTQVVFGDLFLEDVRAYRESRLAGTGLSPVFPLWGRDTSHLAREMIRDGFEARIVCIDPKSVPRRFAGRSFDAALLDELPPNVDPCGENGEFHTFVSAAPPLGLRIPVQIGPTVERDGFVFTDLSLP
ncbi:MAG: ATP-binding protein [Thermoplasmata archaeon]